MDTLIKSDPEHTWNNNNKHKGAVFYFTFSDVHTAFTERFLSM